MTDRSLIVILSLCVASLAVAVWKIYKLVK